MTIVVLHPRHRSAADYARAAIYPQALPNTSEPAVREFLVRRQIALECKRRHVDARDHETAKRMALVALRKQASAACALRIATRYLDTVAPRPRRDPQPFAG